jgi:hypothetical protein
VDMWRADIAQVIGRIVGSRRRPSEAPTAESRDRVRTTR